MSCSQTIKASFKELYILPPKHKMMCMLTKEKIKEDIKNLWSVCFGDTEEFIDLFFKHRYNDFANIYIDNGEKVISALQIITYPFTFSDELLPLGYISGACTHPDFREKGLMKQLLRKSFSAMYERGYVFTALIPGELWLYDYYTKTGYTDVFSHYKKEIKQDDYLPNEDFAVSVITAFDDRVYHYLNTKLKAKDCAVQHTDTDFNIVLQDLSVSSGRCFVATCADTIKGVSVVYQRGDRWEIRELLCDDDSAKAVLIHSAFNLASGKAVELHSMHPIEGGLSCRNGMARVINVDKALAKYAHKRRDFKTCLCVKDDYVEENNGCFKIENGFCERVDEDCVGDCKHINIRDLTDIILRESSPYMSLMMN